ncbi:MULTISPECIES: four helix bundle protein [unclassified Paraflavitalea]|uniref:four helix bundle protein n=1 Tax=unclassified Paraflavitalea TaxID=2798305 RepID=UPI003D33C499
MKEKSMKFSLNIIRYCELLNVQKKYIISNQLLRSGTAIGALIHESKFAESRADFIHKLKIALKEANETLYWLDLCENSEVYPSDFELKHDADELVRILASIVKSSTKS